MPSPFNYNAIFLLKNYVRYLLLGQGKCIRILTMLLLYFQNSFLSFQRKETNNHNSNTYIIGLQTFIGMELYTYICLFILRVYPHICFWIEVNIMKDFRQFRTLISIIICLQEYKNIDMILVSLSTVENYLSDHT